MLRLLDGGGRMVSGPEKRGRGKKTVENRRQPTRELCVKRTQMGESLTVALALQDRQKRMMRTAEELELGALLWS